MKPAWILHEAHYTRPQHSRLEVWMLLQLIGSHFQIWSTDSLWLCFSDQRCPSLFYAPQSSKTRGALEPKGAKIKNTDCILEPGAALNVPNYVLLPLQIRSLFGLLSLSWKDVISAAECEEFQGASRLHLNYCRLFNEVKLQLCPGLNPLFSFLLLKLFPVWINFYFDVFLWSWRKKTLRGYRGASKTSEYQEKFPFFLWLNSRVKLFYHSDSF